MQELFDRLTHCLEPMQVIHSTCTIINDDFLNRTIGRMLFIRLDDFVKTALQLKNKLGKAGNSVQDLEKAINKLEADYENYYAQIRDHLTAHRDDLDIDIRLDLWNNIDLASIEILLNDAELIFDKICLLDSSFGKYAKPKEIENSDVSDALVNFKSDNGEVFIGMDNLALSRPSTISTIACHQSQDRGQQIVSCFDLAKRQIQLLYALESLDCPVLKRTLRASVSLDIINFIEDLFGLPGRPPRNKTFVEIAKEFGFEGTDLLQEYANNLSKDYCDKLIDIRNKVCAHYDTQTPISDLIEILDSINSQDLEHNLVTLWKAFYNVCTQDIRTKIYLIHGEPVKGISETVPTNFEMLFNY